MTTPDKIYATVLNGHVTMAWSDWREDKTDVEYIRADIHEAQIDALKAALEGLYTAVQEVIPGGPDDWRAAKERGGTGAYALRGHSGTVRYRADDMHTVYAQMEDVRVLLEVK